MNNAPPFALARYLPRTKQLLLDSLPQRLWYELVLATQLTERPPMYIGLRLHLFQHPTLRQNRHFHEHTLRRLHWCLQPAIYNYRKNRHQRQSHAAIGKKTASARPNMHTRLFSTPSEQANVHPLVSRFLSLSCTTSSAYGLIVP